MRESYVFYSLSLAFFTLSCWYIFKVWRWYLKKSPIPHSMRYAAAYIPACILSLIFATIVFLVMGFLYGDLNEATATLLQQEKQENDQ